MTGGSGRLLVGWISKVYPGIHCALMSRSDHGEGSYVFLRMPFDLHQAVELSQNMLGANPGTGR
jgi:hypothetical protein